MFAFRRRAVQVNDDVLLVRTRGWMNPKFMSNIRRVGWARVPLINLDVKITHVVLSSRYILTRVSQT